MVNDVLSIWPQQFNFCCSVKFNVGGGTNYKHKGGGGGGNFMFSPLPGHKMGFGIGLRKNRKLN